jgi:DNA replication protein DnaC
MSNIFTGMLESLKLETITQVYSSIAIDVEKHNKTYTAYLTDLASIEIEERRNKTIAQFLKKAQLPRDKLLKDFDITRIPNLSIKSSC